MPLYPVQDLRVGDVLRLPVYRHKPLAIVKVGYNSAIGWWAVFEGKRAPVALSRRLPYWVDRPSPSTSSTKSTQSTMSTTP